MIFHDSSHAAQWYVLKTKYFNLKYKNQTDLKKLSDKLEIADHSNNFSDFFKSDASEKGVEKILASKLDALVYKVQLILDMRKPIKITAKIFPDQAALDNEYYRIYKTRKTMRAWYIFEFNTIYMNAQDLFPGILAHECAHAIIDHYLEIRPPRAAAEILARYVHAHLDKQAKTY
ncbi:MAG: hypothetical protein GY729_11440 [Desulfobacteraceae bacterium]|nr:hypothetical protein [Desulfobacteraceae bacterium]